MKRRRFEINVLLIQKDNNSWIAQCLDYDIATQGKSFNDVTRAFKEVFAGQASLDISRGKEPFEDFTMAPTECWDLFNKARRLEEETVFEVANSGMARTTERVLFATA